MIRALMSDELADRVHSDDPGVTINIYYPPVTEYIIPSPDVFTC